MRPELDRKLSSLPRLEVINAFANTIECKICGKASQFFDVVDLNKVALHNPYMFGPANVHVAYFRCPDCCFLGTDFFDDWSPSDFARFIYNDDYVIIDRDYVSSRPRWVTGLLTPLLKERPATRILDYGAGNCVFSEAMRDAGFHVVNYDPFTFPERPTGKFEVITCVEVMEHSPAPYQTLMDMLSFLAKDGCVLFTQDLQPANITSIRCSWWYAAPRNGHVSLYCDSTLARLAARAGLVYFRGHPLHAFCDPAGRLGASLASQVGTALLCPELGAPDGDADRDDWHAPEGPPFCRFRWTANEVLRWRIFVAQGSPAIVQVRLPYLMEIRDGFAAESRIAIGGFAAQTSIQDSALEAEAGPFDPGEVTISLHTPELVIPATSGPNSDIRRLGLAIGVIKAGQA